MSDSTTPTETASNSEEAPASTTNTKAVSPEGQSPLPDTSNVTQNEDINGVIDGFVEYILSSAGDDKTEAIIKDYLQSATSVGLSRYSQRNQMLLYLQMQNRDADYKNNAKHFAGYNNWMDKHGRHVTQGESGYKIIAPVKGLTCPNCGNTASYHEDNDWLDCPRAGTSPSTWDVDPEEDWSEGVIYYKPVTTFAYSQTEVLDDADPDEVFEPVIEQDPSEGGCDVEELFNVLVDAAENGEFTEEGFDVKVGDPRGPKEVKSGGWSKGGGVFIKEVDNTAKMTKTLIHEITHEINHSDSEDIPKTVKEVEAEAVAFAVASYFGIEDIDSELYIATWVKNAEMEAEQADEEDDVTPHSVIKDRLDVVQETDVEIIETVRDKYNTD